MIVSAHQCNFFPYSGVLEKARQSDVFVAMQHVQFTRGNYHNRFHLGGRWYTMSVNQRLEPLANKVYEQPVSDWNVIKRRLSDYEDVLSDFDPCIGSQLVLTNFRILKKLFDKLHIKAHLELDYPTESNATARLVEICKHYGANEYLSGPSGRDYLDLSLFNKAGILVKFQEPTANPKAAIELLREDALWPNSQIA